MIRVEVLIALAAIAFALAKLTGATHGLSVTTLDIAGTPATIFRPQDGKPAPVVVIAHGFAGSRELMQPFAITLARNGYVAITFDFLGHGKNPHPLRGSITQANGATKALVDQLDTIVAYARTAPGGDGRSRCSAIPWPPTSWCARPWRIPTSPPPSPCRCSRPTSPRRRRATCW